MVTIEEIRRAREWLDGQRAVVHPGPIETIRHALDLAEVTITLRPGETIQRRDLGCDNGNAP